MSQWKIADGKNFRRVRDSIETKALKKELRQVGKGLVRKVKSNAPKRSGALKVSTNQKLTEKGGKVSLIVGSQTKYARTYKGKEVRPARYAHLVQRRTQYLSKSLSSADLGELRDRISRNIKQALS